MNKVKQDRNTYRVNIPEEGVSALFEIRKVDDVDVAISARIANLSAGGVGLVMEEDLKPGAIIFGSLEIENHRPIELSATVKDVRKQFTLKGKEITLRACQFLGVSVTIDQRLSSLVNDLQRSLYARFKK